MKKSLIALLLVVALVVTVSVFAVSAEKPTQLTSDLTENGDGTATGYCPHCNGPATFTALTVESFSANITATGHYYLAETIPATNTKYFAPSASGDVILHLNGKEYHRAQGAAFQTSTANSNFYIMDATTGGGKFQVDGAWGATCGVIYLSNETASFTLYSGDLAYVHGKGTKAANGGVIRVGKGIVNIYSGNLTSTGVSGYGGVVYMAGAYEFNMYGGTISGGSAANGGNIYLGGTDGTKRVSTITGGTITGGVATTSGGNIYVGADAEVNLSNCLVTLGTANAEADTATSTIGGGNIFHSSGAHTIVGAGAVVSNGTAAGNGGNFCQVYGGTLGHSGVHVKDGGKVLGGNAAYGGSISSGNNCYVTVENGGLIDGGVASTGHGGNIYAINTNAINVNAGGTISNGDAKANQGGNIYGGNNKVTITVNGGTVTGGEAKHGGNIMNAASNCYLTSGTVSYGTTTAYGGNVYNNGGKLYIQGATVTNGTAADGGNVYQNGGTTEMTSGTLTLATATGNGGNVYIKQSGGSFTFSGGTISEGSATNYGGGFYSGWGATLNMSGEAKFAKNTAKEGGNIYATGTNLQITGGTITGGTATGSGGNITLAGSSYGSVTNAIISDGTGKNGGNIYYKATNSDQTKDANRAAGVVLGEGTTISGGTATGMGGNIYLNGMYAILTLDGAVLDGAKAAADNGDNIGIWNTDTLHIKGNTVIKNGKKDNNQYKSVYLGDCDDDDPSNEETFNLKVTLDGKADVDYIYFSGYPTDGYELCGLTIKEGYAGAAKLVWQALNLNADSTLTKADFRKANTVLPAHVTAEENYANAATLYVLDNSSSQKPIAYFDTDADQDNELATTGMVGVDADGVEHVITAMPNDDTYAYVKLYAEGATIELKQNVVVDVNNMDAHFVTGDNKLTVVNYRNNDGSLNTKDMFFTVDKAENLANLTEAGRNPVNNYQYIIIPEADNKYSAHHVKVDVDSVSIKPASASLYYNTNLLTNSRVAENALDYGVVLSLVEMPGADFADGKKGELYTCLENFEYGKDGRISMTTQSCLLTGILPEVNLEQGGQIVTSGVAKIYATAYMTIDIDGQPVRVMADKSYDLSLLDIMKIVDETDPSNPSVLKMYDTWENPMQTVWELPRIKAAWETWKASQNA